MTWGGWVGGCGGGGGGGMSELGFQEAVNSYGFRTRFMVFFFLRLRAKTLEVGSTEDCCWWYVVVS